MATHILKLLTVASFAQLAWSATALNMTRPKPTPFVWPVTRTLASDKPGNRSNAIVLAVGITIAFTVILLAGALFWRRHIRKANFAKEVERQNEIIQAIQQSGIFKVKGGLAGAVKTWFPPSPGPQITPPPPVHHARKFPKAAERDELRRQHRFNRAARAQGCMPV